MEKRTMGLVGGLAVVVLMASGALAAQTAEPSIGKGSVAAAQTQRLDTEARSHQITGVISAVDREAKTITIQTRSGPRTFSLAPRAQVKLGKVKATLAEVQPGKQVFIRYRDVEGKALATTVKVL